MQTGGLATESGSRVSICHKHFWSGQGCSRPCKDFRLSSSLITM